MPSPWLTSSAHCSAGHACGAPLKSGELSLSAVGQSGEDKQLLRSSGSALAVASRPLTSELHCQATLELSLPRSFAISLVRTDCTDTLRTAFDALPPATVNHQSHLPSHAPPALPAAVVQARQPKSCNGVQPGAAGYGRGSPGCSCLPTEAAARITRTAGHHAGPSCLPAAQRDPASSSSCSAGPRSAQAPQQQARQGGCQGSGPAGPQPHSPACSGHLLHSL